MHTTINDLKAEIRYKKDKLNEQLIKELNKVGFTSRIERAWETTLDCGKTSVVLSAFKGETFVSTPNGAILNFEISSVDDVSKFKEVILNFAHMQS